METRWADEPGQTEKMLNVILLAEISKDTIQSKINFVQLGPWKLLFPEGGVRSEVAISIFTTRCHSILRTVPFK